MAQIYCIEDIDQLKYIGVTREKNLLNQVSRQRYYKKNKIQETASWNLDLDNCKIYKLEECEKNERYLRHQYWVDNSECVNRN